MQRRTKIVATLGPATRSPEMIESIINAGVDVLRINMAYGNRNDYADKFELVRSLAKQNGRFVAILIDLQGPKLHITRFVDGKIHLMCGQRFILDAALDKEAGDIDRVGIDYEQLVHEVEPGDTLLLDEGRIELIVEDVIGYEIGCKVITGGNLSSDRSLNKKGGGLSTKALTDKDKRDIQIAAELGADYVAVSFPRCAEDMEEARNLLASHGSKAALIAKVERAELVHNDALLDQVILASDAVMIARGDLAVEIGDAELVGVQKHIIARSRALNRVVITATQMMESMIDSAMPTRAEVSDVSNAVFDYTDAVMLAAETAIGEYPLEAVTAMARICVGAENHPSTRTSMHRIHEAMGRVDEAIALSAMYAANHLNGVKAIICMTESGATPLLMSRIESSLPIFAFSRHPSTQNKVALYRGVQTIPFNSDHFPHAEINQRAVGALLERGLVEDGDLVIITKGDYVSAQGGTNSLKIVKVGNLIR